MQLAVVPVPGGVSYRSPFAGGSGTFGRTGCRTGKVQECRTGGLCNRSSVVADRLRASGTRDGVDGAAGETGAQRDRGTPCGAGTAVLADWPPGECRPVAFFSGSHRRRRRAVFDRDAGHLHPVHRWRMHLHSVHRPVRDDPEPVPPTRAALSPVPGGVCDTPRCVNELGAPGDAGQHRPSPPKERGRSRSALIDY